MTQQIFLDDKLCACTKNKELKSSDDFEKLLNELYKICEEHWKPNVKMGETPTFQAKIMIDRTFNSWDLFVSRMKKEKYFLADYLSKYSYKNIFMSNETLKTSYEKL